MLATHVAACLSNWDSVLVYGSSPTACMLHLLSGDLHTSTHAFRREALGSGFVCAYRLTSNLFESVPIGLWPRHM